MYIRIQALVALLLALTAGVASGAQIFGVSDSALDTTGAATQFYPLSIQDVVDDANTRRSTTIQPVEIPVSFDGRFNELACVLSVAPGSGSGEGWTFTLMRNGLATSTLTCSLINTDLRSCATDVSTNRTVLPGDRIALRITTTGTPSASRGTCTVVFYPPGAL
jgi:hypothetical protein